MVMKNMQKLRKVREVEQVRKYKQKITLKKRRKNARHTKEKTSEKNQSR